MLALLSRALLLSLLLSTVAGTASAQSAALIERVRDHDERGQALFAEGDYAAALGELSAAEDLLPATTRLYNMAVCEERLGRPERAIALYRRFAEDETAPADRRQRAQERIEALRTELTAPPRSGEPPPDEPAAVGDPTAAGEPAAAPPRSFQVLPPVAFYASLGVTLASGVALAVLGGVTWSAHEDYLTHTQADLGLDSLEDRGQSLVTATNAVLGVTLACATAALVLAILTRWRRPAASAPEGGL